MQKDLYAPYPSNLIHPTSTGSSQSHTRGGRAASVAGRRQARAEGERAGGRAGARRARLAGARRARRPSTAVVSTHLSRMDLQFLDPFS